MGNSDSSKIKSPVYSKPINTSQQREASNLKRALAFLFTLKQQGNKKHG